MNRLCLYFKKAPASDRWVPGDHLIRPLVRRVLRGKPHYDGVDKTFINLCLGLDKIQMPYVINLPFKNLTIHDRVAVIGRGKACLEGYQQSNQIVAGVGLMDHPGQWPDLCEQYPIKTYLQPSKWAADLYRPYFGSQRVDLWAAGIQTDVWAPKPEVKKDIDVLIYDKIRWRREETQEPRKELIETIAHTRGLNTFHLRYGSYTPEEYQELLSRSRSLVFLCEHESQGLAYQEALSSDVPVLAWENGYCLSPDYEKWFPQKIRATSVPHFDSRCGMKFVGLHDVEDVFDEFWSSVITSAYTPREYILENLTLERSAAEFLEFIER